MVPVANKDGEHFGGVFGSLRGIKSVVDQFKPTEVMVVYDGPNSALRRKMVDKSYKGSRKKEWKRGVVKAYDFLNENEQSDNFSKQIRRLSEYLQFFPVKVISVPYVEADDVIAEVVNHIEKEDVAIIYSTDGDYKQLISKNIACYNPISKLLITEDVFKSKHGFLAENYIYYKVVVGDKSDDLPGVSGIGEKTFIKLFPSLTVEPIKNLDELFAISSNIVGLKSSKESTKKKHKLILDNEDLIRKNWKLMQLHDVDISLQTKSVCREFMEDPPNRFNRLRLRSMFIEDGLNIYVKNFDDWSRTFSILMRG